MSDHEFERYLAILSGLLRLSANRREEIAAELRDHLEERLAELLAQGVSRHQAIITALEEFGDAAGLAGEFLHVFRRQRRRWVMRMTVSSVAICIALGLSVMAIWPNHQLAPPMAQAFAQESTDLFAAEPQPNEKKGRAKKSATNPFADSAAASQVTQTDEAAAPTGDPAELTPEDNNKRTEQKLAKRMKVHYPQISLRDVLHDVAQKYEIDVFVNQKHLEDAQKNLDEAVELEFKSVSGDMLLDIVLRSAGLNYTIQDGIVVVTTSDDLDSMMEVRVYNCRDLIALMHEHPAAVSGMGGMGSMHSGMMGGPPGAMPGGAEGGYGGYSGAMNPAGYGSTPGDGMPGMSGRAEPGAKRMRGAGMGGADMGMSGIGMSGAGMPGAGMEGMSGSIGMGMGGGQGAPGRGIGAAQAGARIPELDALIQVLTHTVMPNSWEEAGGPGTVEAYYGGLLIVNNNPQAHRKIDKLLKMIRDAAQQPPGSVVREK